MSWAAGWHRQEELASVAPPKKKRVSKAEKLKGEKIVGKYSHLFPGEGH